MPVADHVARYAVRLTRQTRREKGDVPDFIRDYVSWGAGPRASQYLVLAAKARAVLYGRYYVSTEDIRAVAGPGPPAPDHHQLQCRGRRAQARRHRQAADQGDVPVDEHEAEQSGKLPKIFKSANAG